MADAALTESGKALIGALKDKWLAKSETAQAAGADAGANPADPDFAQEVERLATAAGIQLTVTGDNNKTAVIQGSGNVVDIR